MPPIEGRIPAGRAKLTAIIRSAKDVILIDHAAQELNVPRLQASKILARWTAEGWLRRAGRVLMFRSPSFHLGKSTFSTTSGCSSQRFLLLLTSVVGLQPNIGT